MKSHFKFVEIHAIDALHFRHRNEGVGVDAVDELHNVGFVGAVGHDDEHLLVVVGVATLGVEKGGAAADLPGDSVAKLLGFSGEDHYLVGLLVAVDNHVEHVGHGDHHGVAHNDILDLAGDEVGAADNHDVEIHDYLAGRDVVVLGENQGNDVGSTAVAAHSEGCPDADAAQGATDDGTHETAELGHLEEVLDMQHLLPEDEAYGGHHDAVDGVGAELGAKHLEAQEY